MATPSGPGFSQRLEEGFKNKIAAIVKSMVPKFIAFLGEVKPLDDIFGADIVTEEINSQLAAQGITLKLTTPVTVTRPAPKPVVKRKKATGTGPLLEYHVQRQVIMGILSATPAILPAEFTTLDVNKAMKKDGHNFKTANTSLILNRDLLGVIPLGKVLSAGQNVNKYKLDGNPIALKRPSKKK